MGVNLGIKFIALSIVFGGAFYYWSDYFKSSNFNVQKVEAEDNNNSLFLNVKENKFIVWNIWTAVSINVGTRFSDKSISNLTTLSDVYEIEYIIKNKEIWRNKIIKENMLALNSYWNALKIDINNELDLSANREKTIDFIIDKLEYNYFNASQNIKTLNNQIAVLSTSLTEAREDITKYKNELKNNFEGWNESWAIESIDEYILAKQKETYSNTYIVFLNEIIVKYKNLNVINYKILNTIKANRLALIKNSSVVIPSSGSEYLSELNLLYKEIE